MGKNYIPQFKADLYMWLYNKHFAKNSWHQQFKYNYQDYGLNRKKNVGIVTHNTI